jgi:hypothetical protein
VGRAGAAIEPDAAHILGVIGDGQLELGRYPAAFATFDGWCGCVPTSPRTRALSYAPRAAGNMPGALAAMRSAPRGPARPDDAPG